MGKLKCRAGDLHNNDCRVGPASQLAAVCRASFRRGSTKKQRRRVAAFGNPTLWLKYKTDLQSSVAQDCRISGHFLPFNPAYDQNFGGNLVSLIKK